MDNTALAPPRITCSCANYLPIAEVLDAEIITPDDAHKGEKKSNNIGAEEAVVETKSYRDDEEDNNNTTGSKEYRPIPI